MPSSNSLSLYYFCFSINKNIKKTLEKVCLLIKKNIFQIKVIIKNNYLYLEVDVWRYKYFKKSRDVKILDSLAKWIS